ncbi:MAG: site-specific DNA-methyltransferase, partial [Armatimonadota bacterium]|nr:site-specific DNA-methyltransferase [Armatimonadota bacterium]
EQDSQDLAVPVVPIYIQEKIQPQAIVEQVRAEAKKGVPQQASLFADFNGISFEDMVDFYRHEQNWSNRMILGDSLLVMTSLAEKEGLKGKVQMIYIDPPYGIKFGSNWQVSTRKRDVKDGSAVDATRQPEQIKAFRDTWQLGIHSYLAYLRDRLVVARELLTETGSVFVQISDENVHRVRCLLDEVFGDENFVSLIPFRKTSNLTALYLPTATDFILWYGKDISQLKYRQLHIAKTFDSVSSDTFGCAELPDGSWRRLNQQEKQAPQALPSDWQLFGLSDLTSSHYYDSPAFDFQGRRFTPKGRYWSTSSSGLQKLAAAGRLAAVGDTLRYKRMLFDFPVMLLNSQWDDTGTGSQTDDRVYVVQTANKVIERCMLMSTDPGDLVLDPTCGGGTTAYVSENWARRWITIDTSRVSLALARTRLMAAKYPYYTLSDSAEGVVKEAEITGKIPPAYKTLDDIKKGFVYKRVPHVTLKAIANNEEIDTIHTKWQEKLEPVREKLNKLLGKTWEEWEIPRDLPPSPQPSPARGEGAGGSCVAEGDEKPRRPLPNPPPQGEGAGGPSAGEAARLLEKWWKLRRERQKEIDASIARNADTELLYDQPYEDNKRIRVTGPFTVESLSPHRRFSVDEKIKLKEEGIAGVKMTVMGGGQFALTIIDNLRKAGVQNTIKNERLKFDRLETFAGEWLHAAGEYTEGDPSTGSGCTKRVAVCIGPEFGTVGPELIREAAKEAVKGIGFDTLIICGFAFEPTVTDEAKQYGNLNVLIARMNADLMMGEDLLKKTGAGNLFMVFGEPDIEIRRVAADSDAGRPLPSPPRNGEGDKVVVKINGLDVYDPTTGEIRSNTTDDIACWFIDTDYNEESFFVRHAYFTGADEPYDKLKRALKAEIDEVAWASLYSTVSRAFDPPSTGKIAVKVINHYGDEVLKVYDV